MDINIKRLIDCQECIPLVAELWLNELGSKWLPHADLEWGIKRSEAHLNREALPMTFVAFHQHKLIGTVSLRADDGIRQDLTPWLGGLIVHPEYRQQKIGELLINQVKEQAKKMQHQKLYLLTFDKTLPLWYEKLGWKFIAMDELCQNPVAVMETEI